MIFQNNEYIQKISLFVSPKNIKLVKNKGLLSAEIKIKSFFFEQRQKYKYPRSIEVAIPISLDDEYDYIKGRNLKPQINMRFFSTGIGRSFNFQVNTIENFTNRLNQLVKQKRKCFKIQTKDYGTGYGFEMENAKWLFFQDNGQNNVKSFGFGDYRPIMEGYIKFTSITKIIPLVFYQSDSINV